MYSSNICGNVNDAKPIKITLYIASSSLKKLFRKYIAIKKVNPVTRVRGIAFLINLLNPVLKDLSNSKIKVIECLIEWRKQKYSVKAKIGVKKKFKIIKDKKSINISALRLAFFLFEINTEDIKLKNKNIIKNWSLKIGESKT